VNPEIVKASRHKEEGQEGCLSVPGYLGEVERHTEIIVRGEDAYGKPQRIKAYDYLARIFQHEIDHLDGVMFIDRVADPSKIHKITEEEAAHPTPEVAEAMALMAGWSREPFYVKLPQFEIPRKREGMCSPPSFMLLIPETFLFSRSRPASSRSADRTGACCPC
jgi:hypothetical protein